MDRYKNRKLSKLKLKAKKQRISNHNNNRRSRPKVAEEAEELEEEDQYVSCCICNKNFRSMKSLFGHMRNHPERGWRGIRPPPLPSDHKNTNTNNSCCSGVSDEVVDQISGGGGGGGGSASGSGSDDLLKCLPKWTRRRTNPNPSSSSATATATAAAAGMWISNEWITEEIPEAAYSLMKLARGPPLRQETIKQAAAAAAAARPRPRTNNNIVKSKSHHSVPWKAYKPAKEQLKNKYNKMKKLINYGDGTSAGWLDQVDNNNFPVKVKQLPNPSTMGEEEEEEVGNINQNPTGFYPPDLNPSSGQVVFEEEEEEEEAPFKPNEEGTVLFPQNTATQLLATDDHGKQVCSLRDFDLNEPYVSLDATDEAAAGLL